MDISFRYDIPNKDDYFHLYQSTGWNNGGVWTDDVLYEALKIVGM